MSTKHLAGATALLLTCLATGAPTATAGGLDDKLPSLDGLVRYGCAVRGPITQIDHSDPSGKTNSVWSVTFWAEHISLFGKKVRKDWKLLYSFRKKRRKGLADCDKFMDRVRKDHRENATLAGSRKRSGEALASTATRTPID